MTTGMAQEPKRLKRTCPRCKWDFTFRKHQRCPGYGAYLVLPSDRTGRYPKKDFWVWDRNKGWYHVDNMEKEMRRTMEKLEEYNTQRERELYPSMRRVQ